MLVLQKTPVYSFFLCFVTSQQVLLYSLFTVLNDKFTETCTRSFAFSPYSGDQPLPSGTCLCAQTWFVSRAGWDRCELGLDKCILFLQRGRPTLFDCRGWLPQIPTVLWWEAEVERDMFGNEWGGWGERLSEADVTPLSSLCLNKSCSRSFYLHMLTGTSEFPEETCREKKMKDKKQRKRTRKSCAHRCS